MYFLSTEVVSTYLFGVPAVARHPLRSSTLTVTRPFAGLLKAMGAWFFNARLMNLRHISAGPILP